MVNKDVIYAKIESLRRCITRIQEKTPENSLILLENYDIQDIISINLERAVQNCVDIATHIIATSNEPAPDTMSKAFLALHHMNYIDKNITDKLVAAVGFRNIAVHAYQNVNWEIVYSIITENLYIFQEFIKQLLQKLENPEGTKE